MVARVPSPPFQTQAQVGGITSAFGITAGNGLGGGGALTDSVTISMTASGVTAAAYGDATSVAQITFNALGQATSATSVPITFPPAGGGTAIVGIAASSQFIVGGSPVTGTGTITIAMQTSSVAAATYGNSTNVGQFAVNAQGQITSASNVAINFPAPTTAVVGLVVSNQFSVSGSPVTGTGSITLSLQTSTVTAGTYGNATVVPQIAVNAQGQVTSASGVAITFPARTIVVTDEGTASATIQVLNFAGAGVTAAATGATALVTIAGAAGSDPWTYTVLGAPFATSSVVAQPTGLEFVPAINTRYEFEAQLMTRTSDVTVGPRPGFQWSTGLTDGVVNVQQTTATSGIVMQFGNINAAVLAPVGALTNNSQSWPAMIWGQLVAGAGAAGTCRVQLASEIATSRTVSLIAGSYLKWRAY